MEGIATHAPVIGYLSEALPDTEFMLIDVGCSGGIDGIWRSLGPRLRALAIDPNIAEIERLRSVETHPGIRYLAALAGLPSDHPFARQKAGQSHWGRSPWERLSVAKSLEMMKSGGPLSTADMVAANQWTEMKLADEVIVIPAYLRDRGIASFDFLKIDVDGADFDILNSFDQDLDTFGVLGVGIEINYFGSTSDTDHTFHNVDRFMRARGFELFGMTVNRYSLAALPSRYLWKLPARTEFGRPLQGDALYIRDLGSSIYDEFTARLPWTKLVNLICLFAAFNLPDCAAEIAVRFRESLNAGCDVDRVLNLLTAQAQDPLEQPLTYREYIRRFESHDSMFFTPSPSAMADAEPPPSGGDFEARPVERDEVLAMLQAELRRTSSQLADARQQVRRARDRIVAMESSKFWKLRWIWFRLKRSVGLGQNE
jgi:Methyltransferase FkbM domain